MGPITPRTTFLTLMGLARLNFTLNIRHLKLTTGNLSTAAGLDTHLGEGLQDHRPVCVEVEDGEAVHLLGDAAGGGQVQPGLPGQDGEDRGVVGGVLGQGKGGGAGAGAVVCLVGEGRDDRPPPADLLQVHLQGLQAAHGPRGLGEGLAWPQL